MAKPVATAYSAGAADYRRAAHRAGPAIATVVAAYAGLGGLGRFLIDGLGQRDIPQVIAGSLVVSLLAIGSELLFSCCSRRWRHTAIAPEY